MEMKTLFFTSRRNVRFHGIGHHDLQNQYDSDHFLIEFQSMIWFDFSIHQRGTEERIHRRHCVHCAADYWVDENISGSKKYSPWNIAIHSILSITQFFFSGSLSEHAWQVIASVALTFPSLACMLYMVCVPIIVIRLEYVLCALQIVLHCVELFYASVFAVSACRPHAYY